MTSKDSGGSNVGVMWMQNGALIAEGVFGYPAAQVQATLPTCGIAITEGSNRGTGIKCQDLRKRPNAGDFFETQGVGSTGTAGDLDGLASFVRPLFGAPDDLTDYSGQVSGTPNRNPFTHASLR